MAPPGGVFSPRGKGGGGKKGGGPAAGPRKRPQKKNSTAEDAIRAADQGWERVFGMKDLKASVEFCADDASFMPPNSPIATGKQAIGQVFSGFFGIPDLKLTWHPTKVGAARSGELGYSVGVYEMSF